jgi:hypothetical protein
VSIIIILFIYYIRVAHAIASIICWSIVLLWATGPVTFYLAQLATMLVWCGASVMAILGASISLFKVLLVTNFDLIFNLDPETLGRRVLVLSLLVGCLPHVVICSYQTAHGVRSAPAVAYLMGESMAAESVNLLQIYGFFWLLASLLMLIAAVLFIPIYTRRHQHAAIAAEHHVHQRTMTSISLARVLVGSSGLALIIMINIIGQVNGLAGDYPIQSILSAGLIGLQFLIFILHENVLKYVRTKFSAMLINWNFSFRKSKNKIDPVV